MTIKEALYKLWCTSEFDVIMDYIRKESKELDSISYVLPDIDVLNNITTENKIVAETIGKIVAKNIMDWLIYRFDNYEKFFKDSQKDK